MIFLLHVALSISSPALSPVPFMSHWRASHARQYQFNRLSACVAVIVLRMCSFLILSSCFNPNMHRSILISFTSIVVSIRLLWLRYAILMCWTTLIRDNNIVCNNTAAVLFHCAVGIGCTKKRLHGVGIEICIYL